MANSDIKISSLPGTVSVANTDVFLVVRDPLGSPTSNTVSLNTLRNQLTISTTPANSTALTILAGTIMVDNTYIYIATSNNVVKRAALSSF